MEEGHPGLGGPEWREEGHTIPDLDQGVATPVGAQKLRSNRPWKDEVATGPADHPVAGPSGRGAVARRMRGAERDLEPCIGPATGDFVGMDLGSAGLRVVQVAPGEDMDTANPRGIDERVEAAFGQFIGGSGWSRHRRRIVPAPPGLVRARGGRRR